MERDLTISKTIEKINSKLEEIDKKWKQYQNIASRRIAC